MEKTLVGLTLLLIGLIFLFSNIGIIDFELGSFIAKYWPFIFILWGLKEILSAMYQRYQYSSKKNSQLIFGLILLVVGSLLQNDRLHLFDITWSDLWKLFWPLLIIYIGYRLLVKRKFFFTYTHELDEHLESHYVSPSFMDDLHEGQYVKKMLVGDMNLGGSPWEMDHTVIKMGIGDVDVDLTKAILYDGETYLLVKGWIGDITILVPEDLPIRVIAHVRVGEASVFEHSQSGSSQLTYTSELYDVAEKKVDMFLHLMVGDITVKRIH